MPAEALELDEMTSKECQDVLKDRSHNVNSIVWSALQRRSGYFSARRPVTSSASGTTDLPSAHSRPFRDSLERPPIPHRLPA